MPRNDLIFVSVASYRDPDCLNTIRNLFAEACAPDRLRIGLCWQYMADEDPPFPDLGKHQRLARVISVPATDSLGPCWARSRIQKLWLGEDYYFQIDSHMRFAPGWDATLIETLNACGSAKPVLSTYPLSFTPPDVLAPDGIVEIKPRYFDKDGILHQHSALHPMPSEPRPPEPTWFVSAGMLFTKGDMLLEVHYDPHLYFLGEEISLAVRLWTHGWDIFNPNRIATYHDYHQNTGRKRHWEDAQHWSKLNRRSIRRLQGLLGLKYAKSTEQSALYSLGTRRTLADYEKASGLNFKERTWQGKPLLKEDIRTDTDTRRNSLPEAANGE